jgi:N-acetylglucosamine transport system permease protein
MAARAENRSPLRAVGLGALYIILVAYAAVVILPMLWLLYTSLKSNREIFASAWGLPATPHWENFVYAWVRAGIGRYFLNSVFVTVVSVALILLISAMAAYALTRFSFRGNRLIFYAFLAGLMIPTQLALVPLFFLINSMRLLDTYTGLILVYIAFSLPFTVFVLSAFFRTLPHELAEAALIDGCTQSQAFWRVMLPLAKPGLVTAAIFNFLGIWNEYLFALVLISSEQLRTLPLGLANLLIVSHYESDWGALFAGLVMVMIPTLLAYSLLQGQLTKGITVGALKG